MLLMIESLLARCSVSLRSRWVSANRRAFSMAMPRLAGNGLHKFEICLVEVVKLLALSIQHANDPSFSDYRHGGFGTRKAILHPDITGILIHIRDQRWLTSFCDPACDAL